MGMTTPASPRVVWVGPSDHDLIAEAITLGDENSKTLGFMPHEVYKQAAATGTLVVLVTDGKAIAYALYSLPRRSIKLKHLCISKQFRKHGLARLLVESISERNGDRTGISLHCRTDYSENKMWPRLGFKRTGTKSGRGYERMELTAWWLDHGHPDLFSTNDSFGPLRVMIDLNVFADIESTYKRVEYEESGALTDITLIDQIELVVSSEINVEIQRSPSGSEREHQLQAARKYSIIRNDPRAIDRTAARFTALVAAAGGLDLSSTPAHISDVRHLVEAYLSGVTVLATRDDEFIKWATGIIGETEVRVIRPSDVILHVDALSRAQEYQPAQLEQTQYTLARVSSGAEAELLPFLRIEQSEKKADYLALTRRLLAQGNRVDPVVLRNPHAEPIALFITKLDEYELAVPLLRINYKRLEDTVIRQILFYIRKQALTNVKSIIRITDPHLGNSVVQAMREDGFIRHGDCSIGFTIASCGSAAEVDAQLSRSASVIGFNLQPLRPGLSAPIATDLEHRLWPAKIIDSELQSFLVPIRPEFATDLFGYPPGLLFRPNTLGISREHVYYRSPLPNRERAPARLLWYASGAERRGGVAAVIACSRLEEVIIAKPGDLHRQFRHLGVWKLEQIATVARDGLSRCLRFADTEIFTTPVSLQRLRALGRRHERNFALQSPELISPDLFTTIYQEGRSGHGRT
jgi:GNAT superfamily N-acetyltransferase